MRPTLAGFVVSGLLGGCAPVLGIEEVGLLRDASLDADATDAPTRDATGDGPARMDGTFERSADGDGSIPLSDASDGGGMPDAEDAIDVGSPADAIDERDAPDALALEASDARLEDASNEADATLVDADGAGQPSSVIPPRLIAPLSTSSVTSRRPNMRWEPALRTDGAHVEVCRDRACTMIITTFDASGVMGAPLVDLPAGTVFWRAFGRLNGQNGSVPSPTWQMTVGARSAPVNNSFGTTLDVNGDGYADVLVGTTANKAYLYTGSAAGLSTTPVVTFDSPGPVASAGDVNGDGYADILVSGGPNKSVLVFHGGTQIRNVPSAEIAPAGLELENFGSSVASAGDIDGDGYTDVLVGADDGGHVYVYRGWQSGLLTRPFATLRGGPGEPGFGRTVASAGDVNADGYADVVLGGKAGRAFVYMGGPEGLNATGFVTLASEGPVTSVAIAVAGAGDFNGDGYSDVVIGDEQAGPNNPGKAYVFLGGASGLSSAASVILTGADASGRFGACVANAGDVDGDGYTDFYVGASAPASNKVYFYRGGSSGLSAIPAVTVSRPQAPGQLGSTFGQSVAGAGDINGDGYADLLAGDPNVENNVGRAYVFNGGASGPSLAPTVTLAGPDPGGFGYYVARRWTLPELRTSPRSSVMRKVTTRRSIEKDST